jgi:pheromone shutdown-related protein TraB
MEIASPVTKEIPHQTSLHDSAGREFIILGTGYIGLDTSEFTDRLLEREKPDSLCLDLDVARAEIIANEAHWESLSIKEVIKQKLLTALLLNLLLAAYLRKLDDTSAEMPGTELYEAKKTAEALSIPVVLADRDLHITYSRAWASLNYRQKFYLLQMAFRRLFRYQKVADETAGELHETDVLSAFLGEVTGLQPLLKETLIDERDQYTVQKMIAAPGDKIVAVVAAGRVQSVCQTMAGQIGPAITELEQVPETSPVKKWASRIIPILLLLALVYIGWTQGGSFIRENLRFWILANSIFTGIGAIIAGGHILTILTAILVAPISPLIPAGPGTVAAIVQAIIRPPLVKDFQTFADDITHLLQWRRNRILKIFLVLTLCGLGSILGTLLGTSKIIWSFFSLN